MLPQMSKPGVNVRSASKPKAGLPQALATLFATQMVSENGILVNNLGGGGQLVAKGGSQQAGGLADC